MSDEYHSRLVSRLYNSYSKSERELLETLDEIEQSRSEVFLYPLIEIYKKIKSKSFSHYFIIALGEINSPTAISVLKDLFQEPDTKESDKIWMLPYFGKNNQFDTSFIKFCLGQIQKLKIEKKIIYEVTSDFNLEKILSFLKSSKTLSDTNLNDLREVVLDANQIRSVRKISLLYWLREKPSENLQYLIDNYEQIRQDNLDIILAHELKGWKGSRVEILIKLIKEKGYARAKEILNEAERETEKEKQQQSLQKQENQYPNIKLVNQIIDLRRKINLVCQADQNLKFDVFIDTETISGQQESVQTREMLVSRCIDLRDILQNITPESRRHNATLDEAKKIIHHITDDGLKKSLNSLQLNLMLKGVKLPTDFFGLRKINQAVSLIAAHPTKTKDLIRTLKPLNLFDLYKKDNWQSLHTEILKLYKDSLDNLLKNFQKTK